MTFGEESQKIIDKLYQGHGHVELTVGILRGDSREILHLGPDRQPSGETLLYPVGSIGKPFTASLLAKYLDAGLLELEAPLSRYIPGLPDRYYPTLRRLATHTSGYGGAPFGMLETLWVLLRMNKPDGFFHKNPHHGRLDTEEIREILESMELKDQDYKFQYSNFGFAVLGNIVGGVTGQCYWDAMTDYVRKDLGLSNTGFGTTSLLGYDKKDQPCKPWEWDRQDGAVPAGALLSTADDLLTFARKQMDGSLSYLQMCRQVHGAGEKDFRSGLAWRLREDGIVWHGGSAGAYSGFLGFCPETDTAVVTAVNYGLADAEGLGFAILKEL